MNYTHPDILKRERDGCLTSAEPLDRCAFCGEPIYEGNKEAIESADYLFCNFECCFRYYEIRHLVEEGNNRC